METMGRSCPSLNGGPAQAQKEVRAASTHRGQLLQLAERLRRGVPQDSTLGHEVDVAFYFEQHDCGPSSQPLPARVVARLRRQFRAERGLEARGVQVLDTDMQDRRAVLQYDDAIACLDFETILAGLTKDQREVAALLATGFRQAEIAAILKVSQQAISRRIERIRRALSTTTFANRGRRAVASQNQV